LPRKGAARELAKKKKEKEKYQEQEGFFLKLSTAEEIFSIGLSG